MSVTESTSLNVLRPLLSSCCRRSRKGRVRRRLGATEYKRGCGWPDSGSPERRGGYNSMWLGAVPSPAGDAFEIHTRHISTHTHVRTHAPTH